MREKNRESNVILVIFVYRVERCSRKLFGEKFFNPQRSQILYSLHSNMTACLGQKYCTKSLFVNFRYWVLKSKKKTASVKI